LERTKTDAIDAQGIARFAAQKRLTPPQLSEAAVKELRELVRLREQAIQQPGDRVRHLHHRSIWAFRSSRASLQRDCPHTKQIDRYDPAA
jgi:transposase